MSQDANHPSDPTSNNPSDSHRRALLQAAAGLASASSLGVQAATAGAARTSAATKPAPTGKPGDFDFLSGRWKIKNRQLRDGKWDEFEGEATVYGILGGIASIEELRIPVKSFSGMGLRLLDIKNKLWADFWVNSKSGVLEPPPTWGSFTNGVGIWDSLDDSVKPNVIVRGVWDRITPTSCRWYQSSSKDDGKTWQDNWLMDWTRAA